MGAKRLNIDWAAAKADYVNNPALTMQDIATKYKVPLPTITMHGKRDNWTRDRDERNRRLLETVAKKTIDDATATLAKHNTRALHIAQRIYEKVANGLEKQLDPKAIRCLAGALESAQRVARLALGASTENTISHDTVTIDDQGLELLNDAELNAFQTLLVKAISGQPGNSSKTGSGTIQ